MIDDNLNRLKVLRGSKLPQSKLNESVVVEILNVVDKRNQLKAQLAELTNSKLAERYKVHVRTIDRVTNFENWTHVVN